MGTRAVTMSNRGVLQAEVIGNADLQYLSIVRFGTVYTGIWR